MLQYIHDGHQGKERCLLRARNTVFWPKITYDIQELIERCIICQEHGRSQSIIGVTQELPPFPWHTLATDIFYWKRMDFLIVADVFSKYFLVRRLANSTSAAVCAEIATIVTELGLPHVIRSDNGPCYTSKEFQQMLQCYNITHQTSSPHHPISNGYNQMSDYWNQSCYSITGSGLLTTYAHGDCHGCCQGIRYTLWLNCLMLWLSSNHTLNLSTLVM